MVDAHISVNGGSQTRRSTEIRSHDMPSGFAPLARPRRMRAAAHSVHGGASSLLRLAQPAGVRWPSGSSLAEWAQRASVALAPEMVSVAEDASEAFVTPLHPSTSLRIGASWR
jgi:hypothetical protein